MFHRRLLGLFFFVWALVQAIAAVVLALRPDRHVPYPWLYWLTAVLMVVAYVLGGWRLRTNDPRAKVLGIILSCLALLSFPIGTALGIYGLWALLHRPRQPAGEVRRDGGEL